MPTPAERAAWAAQRQAEKAAWAAQRQAQRATAQAAQQVAKANATIVANGGNPAPAPTVAPEPPQKRGRKPYSGPDYFEDFTVYELDFGALAAGAVSTQAIAIQADSAFKWTKATYLATASPAVGLTDSTRIIPNCSIQIVDTGSGRQLFNSAVPIPSIFGTGQLPFILPVERIFMPRSTMSVTVTNFDNAATTLLKLSFIGSKIFEYAQ